MNTVFKTNKYHSYIIMSRCYTSLNEKEKYVRIAAQIAGSEGMEMEERLHYHDQMINTLETLNSKVTFVNMAGDNISL